MGLVEAAVKFLEIIESVWSFEAKVYNSIYIECQSITEVKIYGFKKVETKKGSSDELPLSL